MLPLMYTCSSCDTRPSRAVTVISRRAMFSESSASINFPRYICTSQLLVGDTGRATSAVLTPAHLSRLELDRDDVTQRLVQQLDGHTEIGHFACVSLISGTGKGLSVDSGEGGRAD